MYEALGHFTLQKLYVPRNNGNSIRFVVTWFPCSRAQKNKSKLSSVFADCCTYRSG